MGPDHSSRVRSSFPLAMLCVILAGAACVRHDDLKVRVFNDGPGELQDLHLFGGADKGWWSTVAAGTSVGTLLRPQGEPQLSMTYARAGRTFHWRGPAFVPGQGYNVHIHIDPKGAVSEQHCLMPCMLP